MSVTLMPVKKDRFNLYASFSEKPAVILTTHMDTVAPFIPSRIENEIVYGRGACDAKGIIAAMIYAVLNLEKEFQENVGLLFVVGEEVDPRHRDTVGLARDVIHAFGREPGNHHHFVDGALGDLV